MVMVDTDLRSRLEAKTQEEAQLTERLAEALLETQQLRLKAVAYGVHQTGSDIPATLRAGAGSRPRNHGADLATAEHRCLLEWLAKNVDLQRHIQFHAPGVMEVGEHSVTLGHMVQWQLSGISGNLKLNVPQELVRDVQQLLSKAKLGNLPDSAVMEINEMWNLVSVDVVAEDKSHAAIFMVHRNSLQAVVIASWPPSPPAAQMPQATGSPVGQQPQRGQSFDPLAYFTGTQIFESQPPAVVTVGSSSLQASKVSFKCTDGVVHELGLASASDSGCRHGIRWTMGAEGGAPHKHVEELGIDFDGDQRCTLSGPFGAIVMMDPDPGDGQRSLIRKLIIMAMDQQVPVRCTRAVVSEEVQSLGVATGDQVEVEYGGEWFAGILHRIEGEMAHVQCDVDKPSVVTVAHISHVRPTARIVRPPRRLHRRSKTSCF